MAESSAADARKRVLLWHWGRRGGGARYTYELAKSLRDAGDLEVHLSLSRQCEIFTELEGLGLPGNHIDTYVDIPSAAIALFRLPWVRSHFWGYVRRKNVSTVVCTMSHLWNVPVLVGRPKQVPYILVLHDVVPHVGDDKPIRKRLLDREIAEADGIIALTEHTRRQVCDLNGVPVRRTSVVPHGVFPYASLSSPARQLSDHVRVLFFGRLLPYKGLDILLEAYGRMRTKSSRASLSIVGPGDIGPYAEAIRRLPDITVDNRWIPESEIGPIFERADVVVAPYREASQSGVIATAYSAGVPVVVTPVGGLGEQVDNGRSGLVAAAATPDALAAALSRIIEDDALRAACSEGAQRMARETLAWPAIAHRFADSLATLAWKPS